MRELSITEFRRQCLSLLDAIPEEGITVTKRGVPVALIPGKGKPGPLMPNTETPYDLVFS